MASPPSEDGLLLVDKPAGVTSHDVVHGARRALRERRIGHLGTLDPFATGLLVLLVGRATRLAPYVDGEPKQYDALIRFGAETTTDDLTGEVTTTAPPPSEDAVRRGVERLTGELEQIPPAFSAKQVGGERAYDAARRGEPLELRAARVTVHGWTLHEIRPDALRATIVCGGGTYIRSLARDLGRLCGSAAHLGELRRTRSGPFDVADAVPFAELAERGRAALRSPLDALASLAVETLDAATVERVARGMAIPVSASGARAALVDGRDRRLVAVAERRGDRWQPRVVLRDG
jgi:tRNA pseudouridine55 synthase